MLNDLMKPMTLAIVVGIMIFIVTYMHANRFLDWLKWKSIGARDEIVETLEKMFIEVSPNKILLYMALSAVLPALAVFLLILPQFTPAACFALATAFLGWNVPKIVVRKMFTKRMSKFNLQMIDGLGLMANGMKSGLSIIQAMGLVKEEMPDPLSKEFDYILQQNRLGVSV